MLNEREIFDVELEPTRPQTTVRCYCRHLVLYDIEVVRRIVYLNLRVAWITSLAVP